MEQHISQSRQTWSYQRPVRGPIRGVWFDRKMGRAQEWVSKQWLLASGTRGQPSWWWLWCPYLQFVSYHSRWPKKQIKKIDKTVRTQESKLKCFFFVLNWSNYSKFWHVRGRWGASPPLNRKVGCSRPTMIHARCLRMRQPYPAHKIYTSYIIHLLCFLMASNLQSSLRFLFWQFW